MMNRSQGSYVKHKKYIKHIMGVSEGDKRKGREALKWVKFRMAPNFPR